MLETLKNLKLSKVNKHLPKEKLKTPENVKKLFKTIQNIELESNESGSDISDIFEEHHKCSFLLKKSDRRKTLKKNEADKMTMDMFTDLFKDTAKKYRKDLQIGENMLAEDNNTVKLAISCPKPKNRLPDDVKKRIEIILRDEEYFVEPLEKIKLDGSKEDDEEIISSHDALTGLWEQIENKCKGQKFKATHPSFNVWEHDGTHWLEKEGIAPEVLEDAIQKCQNWLTKQTS